jgi:hypothetical protein
LKKCLGVFLIVVLLLVSVQTVFADSSSTPRVTSLTGDNKFSVTLISINDLPGSTLNSSGLILPVGFGNGEKQFNGEGVLVSGLSYGTASACFPIKGITQGWGGKVGRWNGSKWVLLPTTVTTPTDSDHSIACATITSDGPYALLSWVVDPSKLPSSSNPYQPTCSFSVTSVDINTSGPLEYTDYYTTDLMGISINYPGITTGVTVTVTLLSSNPSGSFVMTETGSGTTTDGGEEGILVNFNPRVPLTIYYTNLSYTYLLKIGNCYTTYTVVAD